MRVRAGRGDGDTGRIYVPAAGNTRSSADTGDFHCPTFQEERVPVSLYHGWTLYILEDVPQGVAAVKGLSEIMFGWVPWAREMVAEVTE